MVIAGASITSVPVTPVITIGTRPFQWPVSARFLTIHVQDPLVPRDDYVLAGTSERWRIYPRAHPRSRALCVLALSDINNSPHFLLTHSNKIQARLRLNSEHDGPIADVPAMSWSESSHKFYSRFSCDIRPNSDAEERAITFRRTVDVLSNGLSTYRRLETFLTLDMVDPHELWAYQQQYRGGSL